MTNVARLLLLDELLFRGRSSEQCMWVNLLYCMFLKAESGRGGLFFF